MFLAEKVDVVVLEVGLGGRLDATNCVQTPIVCGVTSLGFDHMELLGNTLRVRHPAVALRRLPAAHAAITATVIWSSQTADTAIFINA